MWGISSNYPRCNSYKEAEQLYNDTKPLRGQPLIRPLDRRSKNAKACIVKQASSYVIRLYNTDIITYFEDGSVLVSVGLWSTTTTATAITAMSPLTCWRHRGDMVVSPSVSKFYAGATKFLVPRDGLLFKPDAQGHLAPVDPPVAFQQTKRVCRDKAKQVRAYFKQVPEYIRAFSAAFEGGQIPVGMTSDPVVYNEPLTEEQAVRVAWGSVLTTHDWAIRKQVICNAPEVSIKAFWNRVYVQCGVIEQLSVELPYGEVPR